MGENLCYLDRFIDFGYCGAFFRQNNKDMIHEKK